jgi:succinate dehydrogenase hydrophobic anchor subunit
MKSSSPPPAPNDGPGIADWLLLAASAIPLLYLPAFLVVLFTSTEDAPPIWFLASTFAVIVLSWIVMAIVVLDAARNKRLEEGAKVGWILFMVLFSAFTTPVYVWRYRFRPRPVQSEG